ncbi:MAG: iron ABC transporter permease [Chloroflexi bacterium]|nr:MAG: iron ABC transporter permease [Chloroflexota bacterium]
MREKLSAKPYSNLPLSLLFFPLPLLFLVLFLLYPLLTILWVSFAPQGRPDLSAVSTVLGDEYYRHVIWFTIWQAALSTVLTLALGLPGAYVFARYRFPAKSALRALSTVPFVLPTVVVAAAFRALLGPQGRVNHLLMLLFGLDQPPLDLRHTLVLILIAHVFYNYAVVLRLVGGFWANLNPRLEEAAAVLGAGRWEVFRHVTLPLLTPVIAAAALLVFIFCFTSFGVVLLLGGPGLATIEVEIYYQTTYFLNLPVAATLAVIQILFNTVLIWLYTRLQARTTVPLDLRPRTATQRRPRSRRARLLVAVNVGLIVMMLVTPLLALIERSLSTTAGYGLTYYHELGVNRRGSILFVPPVEAISNSVYFALLTVALALVLGTLAARLLTSADSARRAGKGVPALLDSIFMLPLSVSAVTLGFGYIIALDKPPLNLRTSPWLIPLAHTLVALPFVVRALLPAMRGMNPRWREVAATLGAPPWRVWLEIDLPIIGRAMLVGAAFAFTVSMGEFGATSLIARPEYPTMPVAIERFLSQPGPLNQGQALAMSTLLMLVCVVAFVAIERFRLGEVGEF